MKYKTIKTGSLSLVSYDINYSRVDQFYKDIS